ncbi:alpha/beta fold hydrolase [Nocardioides marmotae]|uniref:alpha/beta fold hydrolase n=1 Tax=Nocardioides marmotae TaxID=2663857 RepID=UPI0012B63588|nr:alpha/beta fold hydrolase [Nocardioides marmotae]MBC9734846.1 alpha/beta fold hydrolase [Nocardioides marmotae]MTB85947.1 alpha/beta fold hydrolase [Nocardioides marmotae]
MDLVPKPDQVVSAAGNLAHKLLYGGLADLRPMPRTLIDEGTMRELYHYRPLASAGEQGDPGDPVLLVTPLAAPAICFDLRRGCSLVEHLLDTGRPTYLVEYGQVSFRDRSLGMEHWVEDVVPAAIREVSRHAGGRPVHVVGWSLGGIFTLLAAAVDAGLPVASLTALGTPFDVSQVPLVAPLRPLLNLNPTDGRGAITRAYQAMGGAPTPLVRWAFQLSSFQKLVTKPLAVATHLDDTDFLAQLEAVDRFTANMTAYPGRSFGQLYHRFVKGNVLKTGEVVLGDRTIRLEEVAAPVLVFAGANDGIAPVGAVRALLPHLSSSEEVRFEIVPGGHLGMLTGRGARGTTWEVLDEWFEQWSGRSAAQPDAPPADGPAARKGTAKKAPAKKTPAKKAPAKKAAAKKTPAKKTATKKTPAKKAAATKTAAKKATAKKSASTRTATKKSAAKKTTAKKATATRTTKAAGSDAIGTNPTRRYGSGGSRSLAR